MGDVGRQGEGAALTSAPVPYARACYAEAALVPHSAMARWVRQADRIVMIDGCFLRCIGRVVNNLANKDSIVQIDALALHKQYSQVFHMDDVPESQRNATAQLTAEKILAMLKDGDAGTASGACACSK